jgi:hypothetical protein
LQSPAEYVQFWQGADGTPYGSELTELTYSNYELLTEAEIDARLKLSELLDTGDTVVELGALVDGGRRLIFAADRTDSLGDLDLYVADFSLSDSTPGSAPFIYWGVPNSDPNPAERADLP